MDSRIPMDEFEHAFAAEDAPPRHTRADRFRTVAIALLILAAACFAIDIVWIMLSHHEPAGLRLFSAICAAVSVFLFKQFPAPKRVRG